MNLCVIMQTVQYNQSFSKTHHDFAWCTTSTKIKLNNNQHVIILNLLYAQKYNAHHTLSLLYGIYLTHPEEPS